MHGTCVTACTANKMSKRLRVLEGADDSSFSASSSSSSKKRLVSLATVDKWILDHDKTLNTATWLNLRKN